MCDREIASGDSSTDNRNKKNSNSISNYKNAVSCNSVPEGKLTHRPQKSSLSWTGLAASGDRNSHTNTTQRSNVKQITTQCACPDIKGRFDSITHIKM